MRYYLICIILLLLPVQLLSQSDNSDFLKLYDEYIECSKIENYSGCVVILNKSLIECPDISIYSKGWVHNNLGRSYWKLGDFNNAIGYCQTALSFIVDSNSNSIFLANSIYNNLALVYEQIGDRDRALYFYNEAGRKISELKEFDSRYLNRLTANMLNRGIVHYKLNQYQTAIDLLLRAKEIKEKNNQKFLGSVYFNLARSYEQIGEFNLAEENYLKSIDQWKSEYYEGYYQLGSIYNSYGCFLLQYRQDSSSLELFRNAIAIYNEYYNGKHAFLGECFFNISNYYCSYGNHNLALQSIQSALNSLCPDFTLKSIFENPTHCKSLLEIGFLKNIHKKADLLYQATFSDSLTLSGIFVENGKVTINTHQQKLELLTFALETNDLAITRMLNIHTTFPTRESQLYLLENYKKIYLSGIKIASALFNLTNDKTYIESAYCYASQSKAMELEFEQKEKERIYYSSLKDTSYLSILSLAEDISVYENLIQNYTLAKDSVKIDAWQKELFDLEIEYGEKILNFRTARNHDTFSELSRQATTLSDLQKRMRRNETIIEYTLSGPLVKERILYTFVITKREAKLLRQSVDNSFFEECERVAEFIQLDTPKILYEKQDSLEKDLEDLYMKLVMPVKEDMKGNNLVIIPDEELIRILFEALIDPEEGNGSNYLIYNYTVRYLHSSREYFSKSIKTLLKPSFTAISPSYNMGDTQYALPGALNESRILCDMYGGTLLEDVDRVEMVEQIESGDVLHFAMHANAGSSGSSPYLLIHSLTDSLYSNRLYDYEINSLISNAEMVVLGACETGEGEHYSGDGIQSMSRSFALAGVKAVIHTSWKLDDYSSKEIMIGFYKYLKRGMSKTKALQRAKIDYLENQSPSFIHPYYWAGYQLYGNGNRIMISRWYIFLGIVMIFVLVVVVRKHIIANSDVIGS